MEINNIKFGSTDNSEFLKKLQNSSILKDFEKMEVREISCDKTICKFDMNNK